MNSNPSKPLISPGIDLGLIGGFGVVAFAGISKGSGKTTVLAKFVNEYLRKFLAKPDLDFKLAITSIGKGSPEPEVYIGEGMFVATAESLIRNCDITKKIVHTTGLSTPLGQVVVIEAMSAGKVQLAGPVSNGQLAVLCDYFKETLGVHQILVDGAADRRAFLSPKAADAVILCAGASLNPSIDKVCDEISYLCKLSSISIISHIDYVKDKQFAKINDKLEFCQQDTVSYFTVSGALTEAFFKQATTLAATSEIRFLVEDFSKIFVRKDIYDRFLAQGGILFAQKGINLLGVALNPTANELGYEFDRLEFLAKVKEVVNFPVFDVMLPEAWCANEYS